MVQNFYGQFAKTLINLRPTNPVFCTAFSGIISESSSIPVYMTVRISSAGKFICGHINVCMSLSRWNCIKKDLTSFRIACSLNLLQSVLNCQATTSVKCTSWPCIVVTDPYRVNREQKQKNTQNKYDLFNLGIHWNLLRCGFSTVLTKRTGMTRKINTKI